MNTPEDITDIETVKDVARVHGVEAPRFLEDLVRDINALGRIRARAFAEAENAALLEIISEMDRLHSDIMENGPRCTCGDGDEWCARCGKSTKLSNLASRALKT